MALIGNVNGEVVKSAPDHYTLQLRANSELPPKVLWQRLVVPATWWHPDHTYSGDANNLSLELKAGGLWQERWGENGVLHGRVLNLIDGKLLRLDAPFGPLQSMAVNVIWTITIEADGSGSLVTFDEIANGTSASNLEQIAKAVDAVKSQALARLVKMPQVK